MTNSSPSTVSCAQCGAQYRVVRIEAAIEGDPKVACLGCGAPLNARDGTFILKYFRVDRPRERQARAS